MSEPADPRTPAEAKRHWMIDRLWGSAIATALYLAVLIGIVWRGGWGIGTETLRLQILAMIALGAIGIQVVILGTFSLGGPVGRWKARWRDASIEGEDDRAASAYDGGLPR
jgi:hypothetical protein